MLRIRGRLIVVDCEWQLQEQVLCTFIFCATLICTCGDPVVNAEATIYGSILVRSRIPNAVPLLHRW